MNNPSNTYHTPVLLTESVDGLNIKKNGIYIDVTFGGGGHSREILRRLGPEGRLFGFDQDADAYDNMCANSPDIANDRRFTFVRTNFRFLSNWMRYYDVDGVDGIIADLGVSSHHFDDAQRGFSFRFDGPLDMRMNSRATLSGSQVVNDYPEARLADILYTYGELRNARRMAAMICSARRQSPITTTTQLVETVSKAIRPAQQKKELAQVFQAIRIEVNGEMESLKEMLNAATEVLRPGGRLVVITYHSLEDRMVKNIIKPADDNSPESIIFGRAASRYKIINSKVITPSEEETTINPRSRSAKLRIAEKR
ncbi:MAG: 16S rRNA (cytosine(1402)-N(4))-methyltransferase RsmH [Prevotella sp.]|nr:16S rRNA (cytosine(1402)-N(4))-methyltransferase RsmH [Prevotella sp.]